MEDKQKQSEVPSLDQQHGSGSMLAAERKKQQKTLEEIADELNLSITQLKTIELDQTDGLPEPTYVRGYIRGYAKLLGLNPDEVLQNYLNPNWQQTSSLNDIPKGIATTVQDSGNEFFTPAKTIFFMALLGAIGFFWYQGTTSSTVKPKLVQSIKTPKANQSNVVNTPSSSSSIVSDDVSSNSAAEFSGVNDSTTAVEAETVIVGNQLALSFSKATWIDIKDEKGVRLAYKTYAAGELLDIRSELPMSVFIGEAQNVSVEYNGLPFDISEHVQGVYAKFEVGKE